MSDETVIYEYPLQQAIADGELVELFKNRWNTLSGGKPIIATGHLFEDVTLSGLLEIWNEFVEWRIQVAPTLPETGQLFHTKMNGKPFGCWKMPKRLHFSIRRIIDVADLHRAT